MSDILLYLLLFLAVVTVLLLVVSLFRNRHSRSGMDVAVQTLQQSGERVERELRGQIQTTAQGMRQELSGSLAQFQQAIATQMTGAATVQNSHIAAFSTHLEQLGKNNAEQLEKMRQELAQQALAAREEQSASIKRFSDTLQQSLNLLSEGNTRRMAEIRTTLEEKIRDLQNENAKKLEEMRQTVDEKLHATLEQRLGESFKLVSQRLEEVHKGLGEMRSLATGVGDLKRVLSNVKTRGVWGEVQLASLLEQMLTAGQYARNVATRPGSAERVEFAIALPGQHEDTPVWLPIDAKFPMEDYQRLLDAQEAGDAAAAEEAARALENRLKAEAKSIREKYIAPPHTTDFALLYLPIEGLYAEALRRPSLADTLQRQWRVNLAGPTTLAALLNSLQMGFRTLAIEQRSAEVWAVLGAVKTEFGKFGEALAHTKKKLQEASSSIEKAETRTRVLSGKLKTVEALPSGQAQQLLETDGLPDMESD